MTFSATFLWIVLSVTIVFYCIYLPLAVFCEAVNDKKIFYEYLDKSNVSNYIIYKRFLKNLSASNDSLNNSLLKYFMRTEFYCFMYVTILINFHGIVLSFELIDKRSSS